MYSVVKQAQYIAFKLAAMAKLELHNVCTNWGKPERASACLRFINYRFVDSRFVDYFALQLLIASHKQLGGGSGGQNSPVLAFSLRVLGLVSQEYDVLVFSL